MSTSMHGARTTRTSLRQDAGRCAQRVVLFLTAVALFAAATARAADAYGVNPGDKLSVFVWNEESLARELLVAPDGTISFPMVGTLAVRGISTQQIAERIAKGLGEYLRDEPVVTVSLIGVEGNRVYVHGKVTQPGVYVATSRVDIMQALAMAGGLDPYAKLSEIKVVRRGPDGQQEVFRFDYDRFKNGEALESNVMLQSGDVVVVP